MKSVYSSCFELALGAEPNFTTYKYREPHGMTVRVIDYVFQNMFEVMGYLALPESDLIDKFMGNPCKDHPSDHYSLAFDLTFK